MIDVDANQIGSNDGGMQIVFRYCCYLAFAGIALVFWMIYFLLVLGIFPAPVEPACSLEPAGCPPPSLFMQILAPLSIFGAIPITTLVFVFYRQWVRRLCG
jgi:hypothetical protein